jgi:hypothetical protein
VNGARYPADGSYDDQRIVHLYRARLALALTGECNGEHGPGACPDDAAFRASLAEIGIGPRSVAASLLMELITSVAMDAERRHGVDMARKIAERDVAFILEWLRTGSAEEAAAAVPWEVP